MSERRVIILEELWCEKLIICEMEDRRCVGEVRDVRFHGERFTEYCSASSNGDINTGKTYMGIKESLGRIRNILLTYDIGRQSSFVPPSAEVSL